MPVQTALSLDLLRWHGQRHQIAIGEEFSVGDSFWAAPSVYEPSFHIHQQRRIVICGKQRVAEPTKLRIVMNEPVGMMF